MLVVVVAIAVFTGGGSDQKFDGTYVGPLPDILQSALGPGEFIVYLDDGRVRQFGYLIDQQGCIVAVDIPVDKGTGQVSGSITSSTATPVGGAVSSDCASDPDSGDYLLINGVVADERFQFTMNDGSIPISVVVEKVPGRGPPL